MVLVDNCGRPLLNLRVAVTNKCNLRCSYCHAEGEEDAPRQSEEMSADEIVRIVRVAVSLGISRVKLTGGEPLVRRDAPEIIKRLSTVPGLTDVSLTTNGTLLEPLAYELRKNGLRRVNVSFPTLDQTVFHKLTGGDLGLVKKGIHAAVESGLSPVKLNMLVLKDINDTEVPDMIEYASGTGTILQLIELEPINITKSFFSASHEPLDKYEKLLEQKALKIETRRFMQNRHVYHLPDATVEIVRPIENTSFCLNCSRLRVTSHGKLKPCLMRNDNLVDILTPLRKGASDTELVELFKAANTKRQPFH